VKVCKSDCEGTVAGTRGNGEVAPIPAVHETAMEPRGSTHGYRVTLDAIAAVIRCTLGA
jgi:hypothetical protein